MNDVATVFKQVMVYFYAIEPTVAIDAQQTFTPGHYPLDIVFDTLRGLDPATDEYRITEDLFGGEVFCMLHEDGPQALLGAYYKDKFSRPLSEYKGEIREVPLRDGEGIVDAAYAAFFPGDVLGLVRTSSKSPGFAKIGRWLTIQGGYACGLFALPDPDALAQLDREPGKLQRLILRIKRDRVTQVGAYSPSVANALRAAADLSAATTTVGLDLAVKGKDQTLWSHTIREQVQELLGVLLDFDEAKVKVSGVKRPVDLRRANVATTVTVVLQDKKLIGPKEAAEALFEAYRTEGPSIELALKAWHGRRNEASPPTD